MTGIRGFLVVLFVLVFATSFSLPKRRRTARFFRGRSPKKLGRSIRHRAMRTLFEIAPTPRHRIAEEHAKDFSESACIEKRAKEYDLDGVKVERSRVENRLGKIFHCRKTQ